ncbi:coiled-coil domain-containing protein 175 [Ambystoma mexicanum]|uniref:coiled-coil domain-containing protein 175 n=1 Tax=Ambystoma mexicanum TaxID=8296 RepID=UPI0037E92366
MAEIIRAFGSDPLTESPAVSAALEHLSAIEKQLKNEEIEHGTEAIQHLSETVEAIKGLEHVRRATRELLEEESIENSKLRFKILHLPGIITNEMSEAVSMARECNASQIGQLQNELKNILQEIENVNQKHLDMEALNSSLCDHGKKMWDRHELVVDLLNVHMANKADRNIDLNETYNNAKNARQEAVDLRLCLSDLEEDMVLEREQHAKEMEKLNKEIEEMMQLIETKKKRNQDMEECQAGIAVQLFEKEEQVGNIKEIVSNVKNQICQLKNSNTLLTKQLDQRRIQNTELANKKSYLESQVTSIEKECLVKRELLKSKIAKVDDDLQKAQCLKEKLVDKNTALSAQFQRVREEEDFEIERKQDTAQEFEKSSAALEEKQNQLAHLRMEIKEMEEEIEKTKESSQLVIDIYGAQLEESRSSLNQERQKRMTLQVKKDEITKQAELWKHSEDKYINDMNKRLEADKMKLAQLNEECEDLRRDILKRDAELQRYMQEKTKAENETANLEKCYLADIKRLTDESNILKEKLQDRSEELDVKLPVLQKVQNKYDEQNQKYENIKQQVGDLKNKKKILEDTIKLKNHEIHLFSKIKEKCKCEVKKYREEVLNQMKNHTEEAKTIEKNIYETNRKLELVTMENCRLKLNNEQKILEIGKTLQEAENQKSAMLDMDNHLIMLYDLLMKGWDEDSSIRKDFSERDQETLNAIKELVKKIQQREEKLGNITDQLQDQFTGIASLLQSDPAVDPKPK